jgi:protein-L-isoaspartate(D-aspartate) O-methyltransferase
LSVEGDQTTVEERAALLLAVRRAGVRDISVMRAIEAVPREAFAPYRFRDLANRNLSLPLDCGQTMSRPSDLARRIEAMRIGRGHRVLEVGTGSAYGTAIMARLGKEVLTLERFETLAIQAGRRLSALSIVNATALHADGLAPPKTLGELDRIVVQCALEEPPMALLQLLAPGGVLVYVRRGPAGEGARPISRLVKVERSEEGDWRETELGAHPLEPATPGLAQAL